MCSLSEDLLNALTVIELGGRPSAERSERLVAAGLVKIELDGRLVLTPAGAEAVTNHTAAVLRDFGPNRDDSDTAHCS